MTTTQSHSTRSRYSLACTYSCLNPIAVRSPEQTTMSGCWSLISLIARSISPGTKWTSPQWMSEMWAIFIAGKFRAGLEDPLHRPVERPRDERRRRDRQHPREDDVAGDAPPHRREALRRPRPHHRPRDDMSRRDRIPEMRGEVKHRAPGEDRKSTRLNSSHTVISYAVFCLKKKNNVNIRPAPTTPKNSAKLTLHRPPR